MKKEQTYYKPEFKILNEVVAKQPYRIKENREGKFFKNSNKTWDEYITSTYNDKGKYKCFNFSVPSNVTATTSNKTEQYMAGIDLDFDHGKIIVKDITLAELENIISKLSAKSYCVSKSMGYGIHIFITFNSNLRSDEVFRFNVLHYAKQIMKGIKIRGVEIIEYMDHTGSLLNGNSIMYLGNSLKHVHINHDVKLLNVLKLPVNHKSKKKILPIIHQNSDPRVSGKCYQHILNTLAKEPMTSPRYLYLKRLLEMTLKCQSINEGQMDELLSPYLQQACTGESSGERKRYRDLYDGEFNRINEIQNKHRDLWTEIAIEEIKDEDKQEESIESLLERCCDA